MFNFTYDLLVNGMPRFKIFPVSKLNKRDEIFHIDCENHYRNFFLKTLYESDCSLELIQQASKSFKTFECITDSWRTPRRVGFEMGKLCVSSRNLGQTALRYLRDSYKFKQTGFWNEQDDPLFNFCIGHKFALNDAQDSETKLNESLNRELSRNPINLKYMFYYKPPIIQPDTMFIRCIKQLIDKKLV